MGSQGFDNYTSAFGERPFFIYLLNSVAAAAASVLITVVLGVLAGYSSCQFRYRLARRYSGWWC